MIRLSSLSASDVANEVTKWVTSHFDRVGKISGAVGDPVVCVGGPLVYSIRVVVRYAQTGEIAVTRSLHGHLRLIADAIYIPVHPMVTEIDVADVTGNAEPTHAIDVVLRAAMARDAVARQVEHIPISWIAALACLPVQTVRVYGTRRKLKIKSGAVSHADAKRWLTERGVPGFL